MQIDPKYVEIIINKTQITMNTNKQFKKNIRQYLLDSCIDLEAEMMSDGQKTKWIADRFYKEYVHPYNEQRYNGNMVMICTEWLMGLALNVDCYNGQILKAYAELKGVEKLTEEQENYILGFGAHHQQRWFIVLAENLMEMIDEQAKEKYLKEKGLV